ncbi:MAG: hypothetical protein AAFX93_09580 [Verrucomicrobiota bacterium]
MKVFVGIALIIGVVFLFFRFEEQVGDWIFQDIVDDSSSDQQVPINPSNPTSAPVSAHTVLTDVDGRSITCEVVAVNDDTVVIIRDSDQQTFEIPFNRLDGPSQSRVRTIENSISGRGALQNAQLQFDRDLKNAIESMQIQVLCSYRNPECETVENYFLQNDYNYISYDVEKSGAGRRLREEWSISYLPAIKVGDRVLEGFNREIFEEALVKEYRKQ